MPNNFFIKKSESLIEKINKKINWWSLLYDEDLITFTNEINNRPHLGIKINNE